MRRCLILDDESLEGTISGFKKHLANGDEVKYSHQDISVEHEQPSFTKTVNKAIEQLKTGEYDIFACDMQLGFEKDDQYGYDIIQKIISNNVPISFILYSGDFRKLSDILSSRIKDNESPEKVLNAIKEIDSFVDRSEHLDDHVIRILNEKISIYEVIKRNLEKYPSVKLEVCHSGFQDKTCREIAKALEDPKHNANVNKFAEDLIERAINHIMDINK